MRRSRITFNKKPRVKKQRKKVEIVTTCDKCGNPLNRTCARTVMSYIASAGEVVGYCRNGVIKYFCSEECMNESFNTL